MARRIEHLTSFAHPVGEVYSALVDEGHLRDRLGALGGKGGEVLAFTSDGATTSYRLRQGVDASKLPSVARGVLGGDLVIDRAEAWTAAGRTGTVEVTVGGVPGQVDGTITLSEDGTGTKLALTGQVKVSIPLLGGKLESLIADQVVELLDRETAFTDGWLDRRS
ncbi:DUF2505 domain-containing protein [Saccharothrix violaceirubra]|uniref:DUF2505 domain-containing protein n=1 Tax=Saccharothrix violaceirubra TaxID=413306 RepID=A0A7W7WTI1_9PSEU|nr:DUF2505 domain-containing protein [Saccharothrix violaceirubra]MBB4962732.1 hypothetical protein [Saccharothrix violaceirubra]